MLELPKMNLRLKFCNNFYQKNSIFNPFRAEYFTYYISPKFYHVQLKTEFPISVKNSVDPDKMASEKS